MSESDGVLEITVEPAVDDDPVDIGIPLGLQVVMDQQLVIKYPQKYDNIMLVLYKFSWC